MTSHTHKTRESKSQAIANSLPKQQSNRASAFHLSGATPEAVGPVKMQQAINNRPRAKQLRACQELANNNHQIKQLRAYQAMADTFTSQKVQRREALQEQTLQKFEAANETPGHAGSPDKVKPGIKTHLNYFVDGEKVHYNIDDNPALLKSPAYAPGACTDLGPARQNQLPQEDWQVMQRKLAKVEPTLQLKSDITVNEPGLEKEADVMGAKISPSKPNGSVAFKLQSTTFEPRSAAVIQRNIQVNNKSASADYWLLQLDPDSDDTARRKSLTAALEKLDGGKFTTEAEFVRAVASVSAPLEQQYRVEERDAALAERERKAALPQPEILMAPPGYKKAAASSAKKEVDGEFMDTAKIGLELTFNSKQSLTYLTNSGFPSDHVKKAEAKKWWQSMLKSWTGGMEAPYSWDVETRKVGKNKDFGNETGEMEMARVAYRDPSRNDAVVFWWQLSMDPGVVEIQTCPVTGGDMAGPIGDIIKSIYTRANELNFKPGGGGGHVNVDFTTGFKEDYSLVPKILAATDTVIRGLRREHKRLVDTENEGEDPFISTERVKMTVDVHGAWNTNYDPSTKKPRNYYPEWNSDVYETSGRKVKNKETLKTFREAHAKWLLLHPTWAQYLKSSKPEAKITGRGDKEGLSQVLHYQAVNIDHLFDEVATKEADPRRLEFRFFIGQESLDDILESIELIAKILSTAKML